jgi:hypothetical protein
LSVLLIFSVLLGLLFYWIGWRIMIGFDFEQKPLKPGRTAAIWLLIGIGIVIIMLGSAIVSTINALQQ